MRELSASDWGTYEVVRDACRGPRQSPLREDPDPSAIGLSMLDAYRSPVRIAPPPVRAGWLEHGPGRDTDRRGREPFVEFD
jgi:biotin/methionine sulfoxide reductase